MPLDPAFACRVVTRILALCVAVLSLGAQSPVLAQAVLDPQVAASPSFAFSAPAPLSGQAATESREAALACMSQAIVYEAGNEPLEGQQAVAQVILNRARSGLFPRSVCGVIYQGAERRTGCQFTFTCDGSLRRAMPARMFAAAQQVAQSALDGLLPDRVGSATHYHAFYVSPYWAPTLERVGRIGAHIFYSGRGPGAAIRPLASLAALPPSARPTASGPAAPSVLLAPWGLALAPSARRTLD